MIKLLQMLVTCLCLSVPLNAQVEPPIIRCITNDTLFYTPVSNSCGPFLRYEVFSSTSPNGPFSAVAQIIDESADFYVDFNSSTIIQYYYIRPIYDCPGEQLINSDTVSNRPPAVPLLQTVSVVNGAIELSWDLSPSPEATNYSVFLVTDSGIELVGEAPAPNNTFVDDLNDPNQMSLTYLIAANDDCNLQSIFGDPISSVWLSNEVSPCTGEVRLEWNRHLNVEKQELWIVDSNGQNIMVTSIPMDAETFTTNILPSAQVEGFFIRGYTDEQAGEFADSNVSLPSDDIINFMDQIFFTKITTLNDNTIDVEWCWDEMVDVSNYTLMQSGPSGSNNVSEDIIGSTPTTVNETIGVNNAVEEIYAIQVTSSDVCDRDFVSQEIRTIALEVDPVAESTLEIEWTDYAYQEASLVHFALHEVVDGEDKIIFEGRQSRFTQTGTVDGEESCYYVEAIAEGVFLDGSSKTTVITSNTACTRGFPIIRLPNAFNPYGFNSIFRPLFGNVDVIAGYEMSVFSRYGELLFFTNIMDEGWNGRSGLKEMPQGVYSYVVKIDMTNGQTLVLPGSVLLIR